MTVKFIGSHIQWNMRISPRLSPAIHSSLVTVALTPHLLCSVEYTLAVPVHDTFEDLRIVPDRADGAVTYRRLFHAIHEYYDDDADRALGLGEFTMFGGIVVHSHPLSQNTRLVLNAVKCDE